MGALTEVEIFDQMKSSFALAIELCDDLARLPLKGPTYDKFRRQIRLIEGCCKQANTWREDTRWLVFIKLMGDTHQRAGDWLRGFKMPDGSRVKIAEGTLHPCFTKLAENLRGLQTAAEHIRTAATKRVGMILPTVLPPPHRDTRPIGWTGAGNSAANVSRGGILLPNSAGLH